MRLDLLVEVDAQEHAQKRQEVHLEGETNRHFEKHEVDDEGRVDARRQSGCENSLNGPFLRSHHAQNFSQNASQQSADENKQQQHPGRFSHERLVCRDSEDS